jgi:putative serine protease PepD
VILALIAGAVGGFIGAALHPSNTNGTSGSTAGTCDVTSLTSKILPSLVTINVQTPSGGGNGSGSVIDSQGDILTNSHVLAPTGTPNAITVDFARGTSGVPAQVVGRDTATDLAVIRVQGYQGSLQPIAEGDSADLEVGQPVIAAGSPLGLESTVTSGIISALSRYVNVGAGDQAGLLVNAVQTDASINPGNSGGPLTNCSGQQIGVNTAGAQVPSATPASGGSIGLNFAIPIDFARSVADELIKNGVATHSNIGVLAVTVTEEISKTTGHPRGALIDQLIPGLGAAQAGLQAGDVITGIGDKSVNSVDQMLVEVRGYQAGQTVKVTFVRNGETKSAQVRVTGLPAS